MGIEKEKDQQRESEIKNSDDRSMAKAKQNPTKIPVWRDFFMSIPVFLGHLYASTSMSSFVRYLVWGTYIPAQNEKDRKRNNEKNKNKKSTSKSISNDDDDKNNDNNKSKPSQSLLLKKSPLKDTIELISSIR